MDQYPFHHALKFLDEVCIGCSHCMKECPTQAIRICEGKVHLMENRCVDCGMCYRTCPYQAIMVEQDDFKKVYDYQYRILLVPALFFSQFPDKYATRQIYSALMELGFSNIVEVEHSVPILIEAIKQYIQSSQNDKPVISSFCPAIVRLVQVKFPSLTENIMLLKTPVDLTAIYYKRRLLDMGIKEPEIGIFYVTPCAAKIAAVKSPVGERASEVNGVINMDYIYNKVLRILKNDKDEIKPFDGMKFVSSKGLRWSLTHGEADNFEGRCLAIDGIHNVITFLEKLEKEEISDIDFLELRACDEGCPSGILTAENTFITVERVRFRAAKYKRLEKESDHESKMLNFNQYRNYILEENQLEPVKPRSMYKLDDNMLEAMRKIQEVNEIMKILPLVDCGVCGAPSCQAHAEDIVQGKSDIRRCIFIQNDIKEGNPREFLEKVWGNKKLKKSNENEG
ncbi:MAG: 4Fe-4S binding protein [Bacteroidales bacterium]|nr:4Fe-4S binding protein [Bacteroidales bacterium]